jgi:hypothetical protein
MGSEAVAIIGTYLPTLKTADGGQNLCVKNLCVRRDWYF